MNHDYQVMAISNVVITILFLSMVYLNWRLIRTLRMATDTMNSCAETITELTQENERYLAEVTAWRATVK